MPTCCAEKALPVRQLETVHLAISPSDERRLKGSEDKGGEKFLTENQTFDLKHHFRSLIKSKELILIRLEHGLLSVRSRFLGLAT